MVGFLAAPAAPALISAGAQLFGGLFGRKEKKQSTVPNLRGLRAEAEAAGFNPLTALQATGGGSVTTVPGLSSAEVLAEAVQAGLGAYARYDPIEEETRKLNNQLVKAQIEDLAKSQDRMTRTATYQRGAPLQRGGGGGSIDVMEPVQMTDATVNVDSETGLPVAAPVPQDPKTPVLPDYTVQSATGDPIEFETQAGGAAQQMRLGQWAKEMVVGNLAGPTWGPVAVDYIRKQREENSRPDRLYRDDPERDARIKARQEKLDSIGKLYGGANQYRMPDVSDAFDFLKSTEYGNQRGSRRKAVPSNNPLWRSN